MTPLPRSFRPTRLIALGLLVLGLSGCTASSKPASAHAAPMAAKLESAATPLIPKIEAPREVMLGIDVLEAGHFLSIRGKRLGLLTHPAGVDRHGVSTVEILHRAPGVKLVALFATEHGIYGTVPSGKGFSDQVDPRTGLMVHSLYNGRTHKPTKAQLAGIDAMVIDLQDIGVRSYTFAGAMKQVMEGCFEANVEVIILDRPDPLGGLKVDGPLLDPQWMGSALVNEFPMPYVHGLTIAELARMAKDTPGILKISDEARIRGHLTVIPMTGWHRAMRWPETGLVWVPTSPFIPTFDAAMGYPMTGLSSYLGGFRSGIGTLYPFRGISNKSIKLDVLERELDAIHIPGLRFRRVTTTNLKTGQPGVGLYIDVVDWDAWRPTELNFYLMKLACKLEPKNPFAFASKGQVDGFLKLMGSTAFFRDIAAHGARVDVDAYIREWQAQDKLFQERSRRFWLYQ